jgi:16S rRNA (guanine966-N2)-methyltransferase
MRIICGRWRSRQIDWPRSNTRPITDRVREALFDVLGARYGTLAELPPLGVADVFAGGGSLGIEALSRGAERACFFEHDREALEVLKRNLERLSAGPEAAIVPVNIYRHGIKPPAEHRPLDLVFLDPPFADSHDLADDSKVATLLRRLGGADAVTEETLVVLRHEGYAALPETVGQHWRVVDHREYGRNVLDFLAHVRAERRE